MMLTGTLPCFNGCGFPPCLGGTEATGTTVYCPHCGTAGPSKDNIGDATDAWNRIQRGLALQDAVERTEEVERLKLAAFHALRDSKTPEGTPICGKCGATGHVKDECDRLWAGL